MYIEYLKPQDNRRSQEDIINMEENSTTKEIELRMVFNGEKKQRVVVKEMYFKSHGITGGKCLNR